MKQCLAGPEIRQRARDLQEASAIELSNRSEERAQVREAISTVALADQISRELNLSDQGIDLEIEFTDDAHEANQQNALSSIQVKSGDSYLRERKGAGTEIFTIKDARHARYWMAQAFGEGRVSPLLAACSRCSGPRGIFRSSRLRNGSGRRSASVGDLQRRSGGATSGPCCLGQHAQRKPGPASRLAAPAMDGPPRWRALLVGVAGNVGILTVSIRY
jgi:hypothetical protein